MKASTKLHIKANAKLFLKPIYLVVFSSPLLLILALVKDNATITIASIIYSLLLIIAIVSIVVINFRYFSQKIYVEKQEIDSKIVRRYSIDTLSTAIIWTILFSLVTLIYIVAYLLILSGKEYSDQTITSLLSPVLSIYNNGITGIVWLLLILIQIAAIVATINVSFCLSNKNLFKGYKLLAAIFLFLPLVLIEKELIRSMNKWVIYFLGGPEVILANNSTLPIVIALIFEMLFTVVFIILKIYFISVLQRNTNRINHDETRLNMSK